MNTSDFEREYIAIRKKEGRLYDDETVRKLPFVDDPEWRIRAASATKLLDHLRKERITSFIEIGCGNGWLSNYLQEHLNVPATGIDINMTELRQAERISGGKVKFIHGDIFSSAFDDLNADVVILAACVQYFPDPKKLVDRLRGTIHIIDSPIYKKGAAAEARERSRKYFASKDAAGMEQFYFHHEIDAFEGAEYLYKPTRISTLLGGSPFPWIRIRKG